MGTPLENHRSKRHRTSAGDLGLAGGSSQGRKALLCPGWGRGVFGPKNVPQPITLAVPAGQKGPLTSSQVMFILPFTASRVTVPTHCFTSWKERLEVKLEPPGHNLPGSTQGLKISLKPLVQQLGKHSPMPPAPRLTPFSLKSHCSAGCWLVLGHTVSFTLKLTGFGMFGFSS